VLRTVVQRHDGRRGTARRRAAELEPARGPRGHRGVPGLSEQFAQLQRDQFGNAAFADMVSRAVAIEEALGIYGLAQFTPPNLAPPPG